MLSDVEVDELLLLVHSVGAEVLSADDDPPKAPLLVEVLLQGGTDLSPVLVGIFPDS